MIAYKLLTINGKDFTLKGIFKKTKIKKSIYLFFSHFSNYMIEKIFMYIIINLVFSLFFDFKFYFIP